MQNLNPFHPERELPDEIIAAHEFLRSLLKEISIESEITCHSNDQADVYFNLKLKAFSAFQC